MTQTPNVEHPKAVPEFTACVTVPAQKASQCKAKSSDLMGSGPARQAVPGKTSC